MKRFTSIACFLIFVATATAGRQHAVRAVVRVPSHGGSATIIATEQGNTYLLTAAHLFEHGARDSIIVDGEDVPQGTARQIAINPEADLALIQLIAGPAKHVAPVGSRQQKPGTYSPLATTRCAYPAPSKHAPCFLSAKATSSPESGHGTVEAAGPCLT